MKLTILVVVALAGAAAGRVRFTPNQELNGDWNAWKAAFGKSYSDKEEFNRRLIFESNLKKIQHHNLAFSLGETTFTMGVNQFTDLTAEEFGQHHHRHHHKRHHHNHHHHHHHNKTTTADCHPQPDFNVQLPPAIDWRTQGYVTPVKNSGQCLSSLLFSINVALEGQWFRKTGDLIPLSEQNLNDCCGTGAQGCSGESSCITFDANYEYIKDTGIESLADYPDTGADQKCQYDPSKRAARASGFDYISPANDETVLQTYVATTGPISVVVDASQPSFQMYKSGVYDEPKCSSTTLDWAMAIVGYGTDATGGDYWIVKNSWGTNWGMAGYIWMSRNKNNQCGIATETSYPYFSC